MGYYYVLCEERNSRQRSVEIIKDITELEKMVGACTAQAKEDRLYLNSANTIYSLTQKAAKEMISAKEDSELAVKISYALELRRWHKQEV
ncbi:MAG: hypothetical protein QXK37_04080 [Candidatus Woesearchaeota archaeon]